MRLSNQAFLKAQQHYQWRDYPAALEYCQQALELDPENTAVLLLAGMVCEGMGDLADAELHYQEALRIMPGNLSASYQLQSLQQRKASMAAARPLDQAPASAAAEVRRPDAAWPEQASRQRAQMCADFIPAGARVLDLAHGMTALAPFLPAGCEYLPCDWTSHDGRTPICECNKQRLPPPGHATHVTLLEVLEYVEDVPAFLSQLRTYNLPVILTYHATDLAPELDRAARGWVNHFSQQDLKSVLEAAGFWITTSRRLDAEEMIFRLSPAPPPPLTVKTVVVLSAYTLSNFGDRLGYYLINQVLPPSATVHHATFDFKNNCALRNVPEDFDLLVLGIGNSLFKPVLTDELLRILEKAPRAIGIFGTQYRHAIDNERMKAVLDRLHTWYARYEEDILFYGNGRDNVVHLGDWLATAFPMARASNPTPLTLGRDVINEQPLDRLIQRIQKHRKVFSTRVHPFLCALTSADEVAFRSQREDGSGQPSGKFRSLLLDVFGCTYPEETFFAVNKEAVAAYKVKVQTQVAHLRATLASVLGGSS